MSHTKITFRLTGQLYDAQSTRLTKLRRDVVLDSLLALEVPRLNEEIAEPNSEAVRAFIDFNVKQRLKTDGRQISVLLATSTAEQLTEVCNRKLVPRDAFLNRIFLLLLASPNWLATNYFLEKRADVRRAAEEVARKYANPSAEIDNLHAPLAVVEAVLADPFAGLRETWNHLWPDLTGHFYRHVLMETTLLGLNCTVPEDLVPGTAAFASRAQAVRDFDDLIGDKGERK